MTIATRFAVCLLLAMPVATVFSTARAEPLDLQIVRPVRSCEALKSVDMTSIGGDGSIVAAADETTSGGVPVCKVDVRLMPEINATVLLPIESWTQRYLQVGCGGLCGNITLQSGASNGCRVLTDGGFVMAATDMGHTGQDGSWGLDARKRIDFAYRAQHLTSTAAKALIAAFYGQSERYSYFNGCSDGGREALMEAQRYPDDFDGVIAGAPAMLFQVQNTLYHGWQAVSNTAPDGSVILTSDRLPLLHRAVVAACDGLDGAEDGLIAWPAACGFDVASITCAEGKTDTASCLTPAEATVARKFYEGPRDVATGVALTAGQPLYGSELNWQGVYVADDSNGSFMSPNAALPVLRYLAFDKADPDFQIADLRFTTQTLDALRSRHPLFDATNANLDAFEKAGGKLILWHGLADPHISPANTLAYHESLIGRSGDDVVRGFERLYLLPGVSHCGGGEGPGNLDLLTAMMGWVESGSAPDAILTTSTGERSSFGQPDFRAGDRRQAGGPPRRKPLDAVPVTPMSRPVFPYPHVAAYDGKGPVTEGSSWKKGGPASVVTIRDWPGSDLFGAYVPAMR